ncbi:MAG: YfhO family protein [Clostridia bacterium]|nr:YfhO family protein [Clostridia bacterium]
MTFSDMKLNTLRPQKEKKFITFLIAFITASAIFVPYMVLSKGYFIFFGDFNVQQIPFYKMCHDAILNGNMGWSFNTDLGANFIGSYSFYLLGSPFFWVTLLFPSKFVPYLMGPLLILKFSLAAVTGYMYIRRFTKTAVAASLGGLLYAFSGFSVYNIFFNHFHEAIIVFPLLLLSLELLITENKRGVFALTVALCAVTNYFFFFGMVVFCIIYFFVRIFSKAIKVKFSKFLVLLFEAGLGLLMASILLLPSIYAVMENQRITSFVLGWNALMYGKEQIYLNVLQCFFFPPDLPARPVFFPKAEVRWSSLGGWLPLFGTVGVFTLFGNKKGNWKKRLIAVCLFMALVPVLNSAFSFFNTSYYARWFYMPILIICLSTVSLADESNIAFSSGLKWSAAITAAFTLAIGFFPQTDDNGKKIFGLYMQDSEHTYAIRFFISCAIALVSLLILYFLFKLRKSDKNSFFKSSIAFVSVISVVYASIFIACGRSHSYDIKETVIKRGIEAQVDLNDDTAFRIDTYDCIDNTGMYLGYPTINAFHSVVPPSITEFYESIGVERSVASRPETDIPALRPLLSVKYLLNRTNGDNHFADENGNTKMSGYSYKNTTGGYYVFENDNYIPYGFSYEYYTTREYFDTFDGDGKTKLLLKAVLLDDEQIKKYGSILTNVATLDDTYDSETDYETDIETDETVTKKKRSKTTVKLIFTDEEMAFDARRLAKTSADTFTTDSKGFTATVERDKENLVFFSVPFDKGFTATVNGKKAEIEKVNIGFMAVKVPKGKSEIRFNYETPGLALGIKITVGAAAVFVIYAIICLFAVKKKTVLKNFPEGAKLLEDWHKEDIIESTKNSMPYNEQKEFDILDDFPMPDADKGNKNFNGGFKIDNDSFK